MRSKSGPQPSAEQHVREIRRQTRKRYSLEEKIRIALEKLSGECSITEPCRREGIAQGLYFKLSKEFLEAGKNRMSGDKISSIEVGKNADLVVLDQHISNVAPRKISKIKVPATIKDGVFRHRVGL